MDWTDINSCTCTCFTCVYRIDIFFVFVFVYLISLQKNSNFSHQELPLLPLSSIKTSVLSSKKMSHLVKRKLIKPNINLNLDGSEDEEEEKSNEKEGNSLKTNFIICDCVDSDKKNLKNLKDKILIKDSNLMSPLLSENFFFPYTFQTFETNEYSHWVSFKKFKQIRKILVRDEFDLFGILPGFKDEIVKNRMCTACFKTRFKFFGPFPNKCKLCEKLICLKCTCYAQTSNRTRIHIRLLVSNDSTLAKYSLDNPCLPLSFKHNPHRNHSSSTLIQSENYGLRKNSRQSVSLKKLFKSSNSGIPNVIKLCTNCQVFYQNIVSTAR